ncbi:anti-sigma factor [Actibacterium sp. 188UL27-1]|uniref:anti-sigma factor family protein n=1 Tax=Actibacterium sp. 188UL27-1 TaxID=2786961 RepID=UPI00195B28C2|nr:anti-sigma factor [Actibacterium sp. 188UL27-1]MBM7069281.1 anti-sigma factor [Actibacterium sp. 188UL27-1]
MTDLSVKLSAFLDGELGPDETDEITALLETDLEAQAELERLMEADDTASSMFDEMLETPVPIGLAQKLRDMPVDEMVAVGPSWSGRIAAGLVLLALGSAGGYWGAQNLGPGTVTVAKASWLDDIADYHEVYAQQVRHLVEVPASEADHLKAWLGKTVGTSFNIPDLAEYGLTFEGGRLLVAGGKPVAQLMYRKADGTVFALCFQANEPGAAPGKPSFNESTRRGFDFVSWANGGGRYVVIGPEGAPDLNGIAQSAALSI